MWDEALAAGGYECYTRELFSDDQELQKDNYLLFASRLHVVLVWKTHLYHVLALCGIYI